MSSVKSVSFEEADKFVDLAHAQAFKEALGRVLRWGVYSACLWGMERLFTWLRRLREPSVRWSGGDMGEGIGILTIILDGVGVFRLLG